jgi:hypothetical protein
MQAAVTPAVTRYPLRREGAGRAAGGVRLRRFRGALATDLAALALTPDRASIARSMRTTGRMTITAEAAAALGGVSVCPRTRGNLMTVLIFPRGPHTEGG